MLGGLDGVADRLGHRDLPRPLGATDAGDSGREQAGHPAAVGLIPGRGPGAAFPRCQVPEPRYPGASRARFRRGADFTGGHGATLPWRAAVLS